MKNGLIIVVHIAILYFFYMVGMFIQTRFELPFPGSIIGMFLLFLLLVKKVIPVQSIERGTAFLIKHMPLLFIPVTVGILQFLDAFTGKGFLVIIITIISTVMVMAISGRVGEGLVKRKSSKERGVDARDTV